VIAVNNDMQAEPYSLSVTKLCQLLGVPRSTVYYQPRRSKPPKVDGFLANLIYEIIQAFPTFGVRRVWAYLRFRLDYKANIKAVARLMRMNHWTLNKRRKGGRPRVGVKRSVTEKPDQRWATDLAMVFCGPRDGWCTFVPVVDCCTRELLGWELDRSARAKTAQRALEAALLNRFGYVRGAPPGLALRHDNGLVFGSKRYRATASDYKLRQEFITPYTPEENGLCERLIRSFKEECVWQNNFQDIGHARRVIGRWVRWYNTDRPHQALDYRTPNEQAEAFKPKAAA